MNGLECRGDIKLRSTKRDTLSRRARDSHPRLLPRKTEGIPVENGFDQIESAPVERHERGIYI